MIISEKVTDKNNHHLGKNAYTRKNRSIMAKKKINNATAMPI